MYLSFLYALFNKCVVRCLAVLIPNGSYQVKIERKKEDASYEVVYSSGTVKVTNGVLGERFVV